MRKDYTLYFRSNYEGGKGGYDLYKSTLSFDGVWSAPQAVDIANTEETKSSLALLKILIFLFTCLQ